MNEPIWITPGESRLKKMRWRVLTAATLLDGVLKRGGHRWQAVMVTLTYKNITDPDPRDISAYLRHVRQWMKRCGHTCRYVWTAELQQRGALHYHVVFWMPKDLLMPKADKRGWWPHGHTRTEAARCGPAYIAKYVSKTVAVGELGEVMTIPKGFRICGIGGLPERQRQWMAWCRLPAWLRPLVTSYHSMERVPGGGWGSRLTGEYWPSPWKIDSFVSGPMGRFVKLVPAMPGFELRPSKWWPDLLSDAPMPSAAIV